MNGAKECEVCSQAAHSRARLCKRCRKLIDRADTRRKPDKEARIEALRQAWDGQGFRCHYTGVRLVEDNPRDPMYVTFDHREPRNESDVVVATALVNDMKSDLTEDEFRAFVIELAGRFAGGPFREELFRVTRWKR